MRVTGKKGRLRVGKKDEDFNPMEGMANLADVMLVFACGLILALIINWNVDMTTIGQTEEVPEEKYEVEGLEILPKPSMRILRWKKWVRSIEIRILENIM